jgi:hypothetical protein
MRLAAAGLVLLCASPASADQSITASRPGARFGTLRPAVSDPYRQLFEPHKAVQPPTTHQPAAKPKVVCGMSILPADPKIDASMLVEPRAAGIDYKIRAIDPPICNAAR